MRLLLVRHAPAGWPQEPRYRGWSDAPLGEEGLRAARLLARRVAEEAPDAVYASDLSRASGTAREVSSRLGVPLHLRGGLREMAFGEWEGLSHREVLGRDPERYRRWLVDPFGTAPPGGESAAACLARAWEVLEEIRESLPAGSSAVVVSHGGTLRLLLCRLLGMPPANHFRLRLDYCGITTVDWESEPVLSGLNDLSHLRCAR
ncbi:phosphoglycerate mutase [Rubrobacter xylanophilus]|uniref:phosphoglycerate mutase (2,3-diphosphoglycerate-dependent) n=1 Tax=Rubrobacter xylanophilus TaxID=49319 RepID=A0A510HMB7_9ACTN|nr:histidine phosphatase family protein [Rubrobacter xylanophilus]BBL81146.1 phosphoglycerate mutase [Rubrobacter xylanophilus]